MRAKVRVNNIYKHNWEEKDGTVHQYQERVYMAPVYSPDPTSENYTFWNATPAGVIDLHISNPEVFGRFQEGQEFYVDFTPVQ